jgi:hypothetical protein
MLEPGLPLRIHSGRSLEAAEADVLTIDQGHDQSSEPSSVTKPKERVSRRITKHVRAVLIGSRPIPTVAPFLGQALLQEQTRNVSPPGPT